MKKTKGQVTFRIANCYIDIVPYWTQAGLWAFSGNGYWGIMTPLESVLIETATSRLGDFK